MPPGVHLRVVRTIGPARSRARVVAIIDFIAEKAKLPSGQKPAIPDALVIIEGEPL